MSGGRTFAEDYAMGVRRQGERLNKVSELMGRNMIEIKDTMSVMDYVAEDDANQYGEYKYRATYTYDYIKNFCGGTAMIGKNKIDFLKEKNGRARFFWEFKDGIYYADYDEEFHTYKTRYHSRNRSDKSNDGSVVVDVPFSRLIKV